MEQSTISPSSTEEVNMNITEKPTSGAASTEAQATKQLQTQHEKIYSMKNAWDSYQTP